MAALGEVIEITTPELLNDEPIHVKIGSTTLPFFIENPDETVLDVFRIGRPINEAELQPLLPRIFFPHWWPLLANGKVSQSELPFLSIVLVDVGSGRVIYYAVNVPGNSTEHQYGDIVINGLMAEFQKGQPDGLYDLYLFPQDGNIVSILSAKDLSEMTPYQLELIRQAPNYLLIDAARNALTGKKPADIRDFIYDYLQWNVNPFGPNRIKFNIVDERRERMRLWISQYNTPAPQTQPSASFESAPASATLTQQQQQSAPRQPYSAFGTIQQQQPAQTPVGTVAHHTMVVMPPASSSFLPSVAATSTFSKPRPKAPRKALPKIGIAVSSQLVDAEKEVVDETDVYFLPQYRQQLTKETKAACLTFLDFVSHDKEAARLGDAALVQMGRSLVTKTFGTYPKDCAHYFDFDVFRDAQLRGFARSRPDIGMPVPWTRKEQLSRIRNHIK